MQEVTPRADVADELRARGGAVGAPGLEAVAAVVGVNEQAHADLREQSGVKAGVRAIGPRADVADELRPRGGAVGAPKLSAMGAVGGAEEDGRADLREMRRIGVAGSRADVANELRARGGAVGAPELIALGAVGGGEEAAPADAGELGGVG